MTMTRTALAPVFTGAGTIEFADHEYPDPGPGQLLLRVQANAICGTDRDQYFGGSTVVPGHEAAGTVIAAGEGTSTALGIRGAVPRIGADLDSLRAQLSRAVDAAQTTLGGVLAKARFWERIKDTQLNERQRLVINRLLDGFEGKLTTSRYAALAKCSQDTAHRDILALVDYGVLIRNPGGGRSTSYSLRADGRNDAILAQTPRHPR